MSATPAEEIRANSYVGFDTITQQIEHKLLKRGFQFNVIVVGTRQALLDTTILNGLLTSKILHDRSNGARKVDPHQHHLRVPLD